MTGKLKTSITMYFASLRTESRDSFTNTIWYEHLGNNSVGCLRPRSSHTPGRLKKRTSILQATATVWNATPKYWPGKRVNSVKNGSSICVSELFSTTSERSESRQLCCAARRIEHGRTAAGSVSPGHRRLDCSYNGRVQYGIVRPPPSRVL